MKHAKLKHEMGIGESPFQERLRINREMKALSHRLVEIQQEANAGAVRAGLRRMARRKAVVDIVQMNHVCMSGHFRTRDWTSKEFGLDGHHGIVTAEIEPGIQCSISINDTWLEIQVAWKIDDKNHALAEARENVVENYQKARRFFKKYGLRIDCAPAINKALGSMDAFINTTALIHTFHNTGNSARIVKLAKELKSAISLSAKATYIKACVDTYVKA